MMSWQLASYGMSEREQHSLNQLMNILDGRINTKWVYVGEHPWAHLTIARDHDAPERGTGLLAYAGDRRSAKGRLHINWPLPISELRKLLHDAESRLNAHNNSNARCIAWHLTRLKEACWLFRNGTLIVLYPEEDRVDSNVANLDELLRFMTASVNQGIPRILQRPLFTSSSNLPFHMSFKGLIWSLAVGNPVPFNRSATEQQFHITGRPLFGEWRATPTLLRLATLYNRQFATIEQGCLFAKATRQEVMSFLYACELCQLGLLRMSDRCKAMA